MGFYPAQLKSSFPVRKSSGLRVIGDATRIGKLTATSFEKIHNKHGPDRARYTSKILKKGPWRGMPIYVITLEELSTCPKSCPFNKKFGEASGRVKGKGAYCYGANMPFSIRMDHRSPEFYPALKQDLEILSKRHKDGFVIRLHELGDFFSVGYVKFWSRALDKYPNLFIFGYSHCKGKIGYELDDTFLKFPQRFRILNSDLSMKDSYRKEAIASDEKPDGFVTCPQQTGKTPSCSTCGLCMNGRTYVHFKLH